MPDHEGHLFGGDVLGGTDEITFILAVGGVEDHDELAISYRVGEPMLSGTVSKGMGRIERIGTTYGKLGWCRRWYQSVVWCR